MGWWWFTRICHSITNFFFNEIIKVLPIALFGLWIQFGFLEGGFIIRVLLSLWRWALLVTFNCTHSWRGRGLFLGTILLLGISLGFYSIPTGTIQSYFYWRYCLVLQRWLDGGSYLGFKKVGMGLRCRLEIDAPFSDPTKTVGRFSYVGPCGNIIWRVWCIVHRDCPTGFLPPKYEELFQLGGRNYLSCYSFGTLGHPLLGNWYYHIFEKEM